MKKPLFVAVMAVGVLAFAGSQVQAQEVTALSHVPFAFFVDGHQMAAGDYRVYPDPSLENVVQIVSNDGRSATFSIFEGTGLGYNNGDASKLEFKKIGSAYVLWRVSIPGRDTFELPLARPKGVEPALAKAGAVKTHLGND